MKSKMAVDVVSGPLEDADLESIAEKILEAKEYLDDPEMMAKLKPIFEKKSKALAGLAGLKQKIKKDGIKEAKLAGSAPKP